MVNVSTVQCSSDFNHMQQSMYLVALFVKTYFITLTSDDGEQKRKG